MFTMFELMLQLPIFQGLSYMQLTEIIEKIPFCFAQYAPGDVIQERGEMCEQVLFVLNGTVQQTTPTFGGKIQIVQDFVGPHTLSFYYLFGVENHTNSELRALTKLGMMHVEKKHFLKMLQNNSIMLVNVMNMLSTHAQKQHVAMEFTSLADSTLRLASWLLAYTDKKATGIKIVADEETWKSLIRLEGADFSRSIAILEGRGCLEMENDTLKLIDRYALRRFVGEKTVPKW